MSAPVGSDSVARASSPAPTPPNVESTHDRDMTPCRMASMSSANQIPDQTSPV
jgi:hypothetical protein